MDLDITGGTGGVGAALEDLTAAAQRIAETAADVAQAATLVLRAALSPELLAAAPVCPVESARLSAGLADLAGPRGLGGEAVSLGVLAAGVRSAVAAYAAGEEAVARLVESAQDTAVLMLSRQALPLGVGALALRWAGVDVGAASDRLLFAVPGLVDLAGGVEGVVAGPAAPLDYEDGVGLLARAGALGGLLTEAGWEVRVAPADPSGPARAPASIADLVAAQADVGGPPGQPSRVRVVEVPQDDASSAWVVVLPGTQDWSPQGGRNPSDLTTDVLLMAEEPCLLAAGVEQALDRRTARRRAPRPRRPGAAGRPQPGRHRRGGSRG